MKLATPRNSMNQAFTLTEVLVVIAVLAILAAILIPVVGRARESALRTSCVANLRSLLQATQVSVVDNGGKYPHLHSGGNIAPYFAHKDRLHAFARKYGLSLDNFYCPSNDEWSASRYQNYNDWDSVMGYVYYANDNEWVRQVYITDAPTSEDKDHAFVSSSFDNPTYRVLWSDLTRQYGGSWGSGANHKSPSAENPDGQHVGFIDGHVEWVDWENMEERFVRAASLKVYF
ncbi:type II secretion system protein [Puniceicoccus vermicola]|uniref:Type II secretion system protein n=1 Tax=Puniceicoccus vermicola TaxID=388746 RepID=A0A7X1B361_9BACT|nr:type II secretion system protein [Puniceicoccus vermicola]MBC2603688.1 type II secretion system protein [Puniceicoccus vermicola]